MHYNLTYDVIDSTGGLISQKTITVKVPRGVHAFDVYEATAKARFQDFSLEFNHAGKTVIISNTKC